MGLSIPVPAFNPQTVPIERQGYYENTATLTSPPKGWSLAYSYFLLEKETSGRAAVRGKPWKRSFFCLKKDGKYWL